MIETIIKIEGMACSMCESHMKDVIRRLYPDAKISASHKKAEVRVISDSPLDVSRIKEEVLKTGYTFAGAQSGPYEKKGFFSSWFGK